MKCIMTNQQIDFFRLNIPDADIVLQSTTLRDLLLPLDAFISDQGMDDDYNLNSLGILAQKIYDDIYFANM